jgi:hypothetical protein
VLCQVHEHVAGKDPLVGDDCRPVRSVNDASLKSQVVGRQPLLATETDLRPGSVT